MERVAIFIIGASLAVVVMSFWPERPAAIRLPVGQTTAETSQQARILSAGAGMHQHPPREVSPDRPFPRVTHLVFPDSMDGYNIQILTQNFKFTPAAINQAPSDNEGHAHLYVNGTKTARIYSSWYHLPGVLLQPGANEIRITLNANDHGEWAIDGQAISSVVHVNLPEEEI